jgi:hypothetical protein
MWPEMQYCSAQKSKVNKEREKYVEKRTNLVLLGQRRRRTLTGGLYHRHILAESTIKFL